MGVGPRYFLRATLAYTEMKVFLAVPARTVDVGLVDTNGLEAPIVFKRMSVIPQIANGAPIAVKPSTEPAALSELIQRSRATGVCLRSIKKQR